jgi:type 1 glutamine amidotransferase
MMKMNFKHPQILQMALVGILLTISSCDVKSKRMETVDQGYNILLFTKTAEFRHEAIEAGVLAIEAMAENNAWTIIHSEDSAIFNINSLDSVHVVIFLNTSGPIFNEEERAAFAHYISRGGNFLGVHAATDTEKDWPYYTNLLGAVFDSHPEVQAARITKNMKSDHPSIQHFPNEFWMTDEWYNFKDTLSTEFTILLELEEDSYEGIRMGTRHPLSWYREIGESRIFYTGLGHELSMYQNPDFLHHLEQAIKWTIKNTTP